jgi:glycosyltransferase involved in cell wall biosynthesis
MSATYYPPYHLGGDAIHVKYLASELAKIGHEVHIFYSRDAYNIKRRHLPYLVESENILIHEFKTHSNLSPYSAYFFGNSPTLRRAFRDLVREIKPQVVHHHNISLLGFGILNNTGSVATLYTAHDYWLICSQNDLLNNGYSECINPSCLTCALRHRKPPQLWRYSNSFKNSLRKIDLIIAPCRFLQVRLEQKIDIKSVVIRNFAPYPPSCIPESNYSDYFLFVGALEEHKGIRNLLEVFRRSKNKIGAKLLIVGDGSLKTYIEDFIRQHNLDDFVIFLGALQKDQLYPLYKGAFALLMPSICPENSPLVIIEAMSVGTPAIVSNMGGLPEIMRIVDDSLIFNNLKELENILINFPKKRPDKVKVAEKYTENFSPKIYINRYIKSIEALR